MLCDTTILRGISCKVKYREAYVADKEFRQLCSTVCKVVF